MQHFWQSTICTAFFLHRLLLEFYLSLTCHQTLAHKIHTKSIESKFATLIILLMAFQYYVLIILRHNIKKDIYGY